MDNRARDDLSLSRAQIPAEDVHWRRLIVDDDERRTQADGLKRPITVGLGANLRDDGLRYRDLMHQRTESASCSLFASRINADALMIQRLCAMDLVRKLIGFDLTGGNRAS